MARYDQGCGTDWDALTRDDAIERAYALGVSAAVLAEYHPDDRDRIRGEMDSADDESVVDLAFEEGKTEAREYRATARDDGPPAWAALVEPDADPGEEGTPTGGQFGLTEFIDCIEAIDRPDFLERD
jgi:hypothetical protein